MGSGTPLKCTEEDQEAEAEAEEGAEAEADQEAEAEAEASSDASAAIAGGVAGGLVVLVIAAVMLYKKKTAEGGVEKSVWERELSSASLSSRKVVPTEFSDEPERALNKQNSWAERRSESPPSYDADSRAISDLYREPSRLSQISLSRAGTATSIDMTPVSRRESAQSIELTDDHFGTHAADAQRRSVDYTAEQVLQALEALNYERAAALPNFFEEDDYLDIDEPVALGEAPAPPTSIGALHMGLGSFLAESDL